MLGPPIVNKLRIYNVIIIITVTVGTRYHVVLKVRFSGIQVFRGYIIWVRKDIGFKAIPNSSIS